MARQQVSLLAASQLKAKTLNKRYALFTILHIVFQQYSSARIFIANAALAGAKKMKLVGFQVF